MDAALRFLLRLLVVPLGYLAGMAATMLLVLVGYWDLRNMFAGLDEVELFAILDVLMAATMTLTTLVLTMWAVASVGILCAEVFGIRSWLYHVGNGAISAWIAGQMFAPYARSPAPGDADLYVLVAGLAGGLAYWLVAGWNAGFWKPAAATPWGGAEPPEPEVLPPEASVPQIGRAHV